MNSTEAELFETIGDKANPNLAQQVTVGSLMIHSPNEATVPDALSVLLSQAATGHAGLKLGFCEPATQTYVQDTVVECVAWGNRWQGSVKVRYSCGCCRMQGLRFVESLQYLLMS